jgi:ribA/ribD-fused uncharacterized protein
MIPPIQNNQTVHSPPAQGGISRQQNAAPFLTDHLRTTSVMPAFCVYIGICIKNFINFIISLFYCFFKQNPPSIPSPQQTIPSPQQTASLQQNIARIAARDQFIWFYKQEENPLTAFLGNFHPCPVQIWGCQFNGGEPAYQAAKFSEEEVRQSFQHLNGEQAFRRGRQLTANWTPQQTAAWQARNLDVMRQVVLAKFQQNPELRQLLLATGDAYLVEHIPVKGRDRIWGDDWDGTGENKLGEICMEVRGQLGGVGIRPRPPQYEQFVRNLRRQGVR